MAWQESALANRGIDPYHRIAMKLGADLSAAPAAAPEGGEAPFTAVAGDAAGGLLLLCDHASNRVPDEYAGLGLPASEFVRHIAYDPGAALVTRHLARRLSAPAVLSNFSRLLIDANRGDDDPTLIMRLSDGAVVPGNASVDDGERARRIRLFHAPYHAAIEAAIDRALVLGRPPALVSIHSFTAVWRGRTRPWHAGILWDRDPRLAVPLLEALRADASLVVGDNEPYSGVLPNDTMWRHGSARGLAYVLIEIRQDLIGDDAGAIAWAGRLAPILAALNARAEVHRIAEPATRGQARLSGG